MNSTVRSIALTIALLTPGLTLSAQEIYLRAGTLLECTLEEPNFSSKSAAVGDPLICYAGSLREFGRPVFPRGSYFVGRFVDHQNPGRLVGKGWLKLDFDRLILPHADVPIKTKVVSVRGYKVDAEGRILGKGHPKRDAFGWMLPILWPIKVITLPQRGPYPMLKGELPITLRLLDDAPIPEHPNATRKLSRMEGEEARPEVVRREPARRRFITRIPVLGR